jgi:hypothetical protein
MDYNTTEYDYEISKAILKGALNSIQSSINMVLHPLDNLVYPISDLIYDATIISTKYIVNDDIMNGDLLMLKHIVDKNPQLYNDSQHQMNNRITAVKDKFTNTTVLEKIELLSEFTTTIFVPGFFLKDIKYLSGVNDVMTAASFVPKGDIKENTTRDNIGNIKSLTKEEIASLAGFHQLLYMEINEQPIITHYLHCNLVDAMILHPELASLIKVNNAEIIYVNDGKIITDTKLNGDLPTISNNDVILAAKNAKQAFNQLSNLKEISMEDKKNITEKLLSIAKPLHHFGVIGSDISSVALMVGGHKRTWNNIAKVSQCSLKIATSLTTLSTAAVSGCIIGGITGGIGCITGIIGAFSAMFGDNEDDGLQQISEAIIAVHQAVIDLHRDMIQCFQRIEEILMVSVISQLTQINFKLNRLERITSQSFKELHTKELIDIVDALNKAVTGEYILNENEKKSYLRQLSSWIDNHSKSSLQTDILRKNGNTDKIIEIFNETNIFTSLPLFFNELINLCPNIKNIIDLTNIPNISILSMACEIYTIASKRLKVAGISKDVIKRAQNTLLNVNKTIEKLKTYTLVDESLLDILNRQYDNYRYWSGQLICKIRNGASWTSDESLISVIGKLPDTLNKSTLYELLDELELRRFFIIKLSELFGLGKPILESKNDLLTKPCSDFNNRIITNYFKNGDLKNIKKSMEYGADQNIWDSWGMPIHYLTKCNGSHIALHLLFKTHPLCISLISGGTRYNQGDTWGVGANPTLHAMNLGFFCQGILFCAHGLDISEADGRSGGSIPFNNTHMGNAYWWVDTGHINSIVNTRLVKQFNTESSCLYREKLRKAYNYYKNVEAGIFSNDIKFSVESLLLLTVILGDVFPLKYFLYNTNTITINSILSDVIPHVGIKYWDIAVACNNTLVMDYLNSIVSTPINSLSTIDTSKLTAIASNNEIIWKINKENVVMNDNNDDIITYINKLVEKLELFMNDEITLNNNNDIILYVNLLTDIVTSIPKDNKYYIILNKYITDINNTTEVSILCKLLNSIDAILVSTPNINYNLSSHIMNLILDLRKSI